MRNLKKILALVLALVMSLSLVTVANAAYVDGKLDTDEDVNENYDEAVTVLMDMGIFQGYNDGESFEPQKNITRAEVATLLYRIVTADIEGKQANLYVDGAKFTDLTGYGWAKGYIGYCANGGIAKGRNATTFAPGDEITGYEVLAMILRAIGYDKNGEFTGANWSTEVASTAQKLGILEKVDAASAQLSKPATRELVAELLFRTMVDANMVEYTTAFGYQSINYDVNKELGTLGWKNFYLQNSLDNGVDADIDDYGRPGWVWTWGHSDFNTAWTYYGSSEFIYSPAEVYDTAVTECDVAHDIGLRNATSMYVMVNGSTATRYDLQPTDTTSKLGAQGRLTEVYRNDFADRWEMVMIDTYLAEVIGVTPAVKDAAGHTAVSAKTTLRVWDNTTPNSYTNISVSYDAGYEVGTYVLVQSANTTGSTATVAGTVNKVYDILGEAEGITGKQTVINYYVDGHTVNGVYYNDAHTLVLDEAINDTAAHVWYFDTYGNIIGIVDIPDTYHYGVIESIQWMTQVGDYGYAWATIKTMDGGSITGAVAKFNAMSMTKESTNAVGNMSSATVSTELWNNYEYVGAHLYQIAVDGNDMLVLTEIDGTTTTNVDNGKITTLGTMGKGEHNTLGITNKVVDDNTVYLYGYNNGVWSKYTTVSYTGFNKIVDFDYTEVDYVDVNKDGRIDYVYVIGDDAYSTGAGLFYMTNKSAVYTIGDYVVVNGVLDGAQKDVSFTLAAYNSMISAFDDDGNGHVLFAVGMKNGVVEHVVDYGSYTIGTALTDGTNTYNWNNNYKSYYKNVVAKTATVSDKYAGNVLTLNSMNYNVTGASTVIYVTKQGAVETTLVEGANYAGYHFTVVYCSDTMVAKYIYIFDPLTDGAFKPWTPSGVETYAVTASVSGMNQTVKVTHKVDGTDKMISTTDAYYLTVTVVNMSANNKTYTSVGTWAASNNNASVNVDCEVTSGNVLYVTYTISKNADGTDVYGYGSQYVVAD